MTDYDEFKGKWSFDMKSFGVCINPCLLIEN